MIIIQKLNDKSSSSNYNEAMMKTYLNEIADIQKKSDEPKSAKEYYSLSYLDNDVHKVLIDNAQDYETLEGKEISVDGLTPVEEVHWSRMNDVSSYIHTSWKVDISEYTDMFMLATTESNNKRTMISRASKMKIVIDVINRDIWSKVKQTPRTKIVSRDISYENNKIELTYFVSAKPWETCVVNALYALVFTGDTETLTIDCKTYEVSKPLIDYDPSVINEQPRLFDEFKIYDSKIYDRELENFIDKLDYSIEIVKEPKRYTKEELATINKYVLEPIRIDVRYWKTESVDVGTANEMTVSGNSPYVRILNMRFTKKELQDYCKNIKQSMIINKKLFEGKIATVGNRPCKSSNYIMIKDVIDCKEEGEMVSVFFRCYTFSDNLEVDLAASFINTGVPNDFDNPEPYIFDFRPIIDLKKSEFGTDD